MTLKTMLAFIKVMAIVACFSYGLFYVAYKYNQPELGNKDYFAYQKMIDTPFNLKATYAPFSLRQTPTTIAYLIKKSGIFYNAQVAYILKDSRRNENNQRNFFALIFANYLAFVLAISLIIFFIKLFWPQKKDSEIYLPILAFSLGYFMVAVNIIGPMTEAFGWLSTVIITIGILKRNLLFVFAGLLLAITSRETVVIFFTVFLFACIIYNFIYKQQQKFFMCAFSMSILLFAAYYFIRVNYAHGFEMQLSIKSLIATAFTEGWRDYVFQVFLTQALVALLFYKLFKVNSLLAICYLTAIGFIVLIGGIGTSRYISQTYPFLVILNFIPPSYLRKQALIQANNQ